MNFLRERDSVDVVCTCTERHVHRSLTYLPQKKKKKRKKIEERNELVGRRCLYPLYTHTVGVKQ